jgi:hypothetical protein
MSVRKTVTSITFSSELPASSRIAFTFSRHERVCASMPAAIASVSRLRGPIPETKSRLPKRRACGYGPTGLGALAETTILSSGPQRHRRVGRSSHDAYNIGLADGRAAMQLQAINFARGSTSTELPETAGLQQEGLRGGRFHRHGRRRPNSRKDYHIDEGPGLLPARRREMVPKTIQEGRSWTSDPRGRDVPDPAHSHSAAALRRVG